MFELLGNGIAETLYMTVVSTALSYVFGLPLGVLLCVTDKNGVFRMPVFNKVLGFIINFLRSVPFLILLVAILPFLGQSSEQPLDRCNYRSTRCGSLALYCKNG